MYKRLVLPLFFGVAIAAYGQFAPAPQNSPASETTAAPSSQAPAQPPAQPAPAPADQSQNGFKRREEQSAGPYQIPVGTHVLLSMINSVSTKQAQVGDRIYLETAFPVIANGRIVIPQGSWVTGTITQVKRPGKVKGRGELQVRFDSLTLPNGVSRDFRSDLGSLDGQNPGTLKREESKVSGPGDKKTDVGTVVGATTAGTVIGTGVGAASGNWGKGAGIGAGAGAAAGLLGVLLTRGPEAILPKGSSVEMVLDRSLTFNEQDLDFSKAPEHAALPVGSAPAQQQRRGLGSRLPF
jgi:hypothetical protein